MDKPLPKSVCEEAIFKQIFFQYAKLLRNFLYYKCGNVDQAEDLVQEAFLRLWKQCKTVSYEKSKGFLFKVVNNLLLDEVKHHKVVLKFQQSQTWLATEKDPQFLLEEQEFKTQLEEVINRLPEKSRTVFLLNRIEQLTYREIAELLEISVKAVEKRMHKALVEVRKLTDKIGE